MSIKEKISYNESQKTPTLCTNSVKSDNVLVQIAIMNKKIMELVNICISEQEKMNLKKIDDEKKNNILVKLIETIYVKINIIDTKIIVRQV